VAAQRVATPFPSQGRGAVSGSKTAEVTPDGTPSWKDEDDLESAIRDVPLAKTQSEQARAEGQRVIEERPADWVGGLETACRVDIAGAGR
jgi:hypothetical protein